MKDKYIVFDLDDTLYYEFDFLKSAFLEIASKLSSDNPNFLLDDMINLYNEGKDVMDFVSVKFEVPKNDLLQMYRCHFPKIKLRDGVLDVLTYLRDHDVKMGLLTDGRSISQRNKIKALEIESFFDKIIISEEFGSEKPNEKNYKVFQETDCDYVYVGDNPKKDFVSANKLGWITVMIDDDLNKKIHKIPNNLDINYLAKKNSNWKDLLFCIS